MFLERFIPKKFYVKSEVCALEAVFNDSGITYHYSVLKNTGKKLDLVYKGITKDKIDLPKQILKSKIPIVLVVNGKGVIVKKISLSQEPQTPEQIIEQNLPTLNKEELFVQVFTQADNTAFIVLCRRESVNVIIEELRRNKYELANVLIGVPAMIGLEPLWSELNAIPSTLHSVELRNGTIENIQNVIDPNGKIEIGGLVIEKENTLGFAGGLSYLMQRKIAENPEGELERFYATHVEKNKLKLFTLTVVGIAFLIAVINVLFYTGYFDKNNKLETELSVYQGKYDQINQLLSAYESKKGLIEDAGILNKNNLSEYADKIGASMPEEVMLTEMYFNPPKEMESEDSLVSFRSKQLIIKGNCNKSLIVNEWLNVLKMQDFIKDVSLQKFSYNKEGILPNFEIRILTK